MVATMFSAPGLLAATMFAGAAMAQGIYTCTDGKGRKITSDRPIAECMDRPQQEISPQGTVKRVIPPSLTAQERAAAEEKEKLAAEARVQAVEEKRRDRALLQRYPNKAAHDKERGLALAQVEEMVKTSSKRAQELVDQRKLINAELEFYRNDPGKAPPALRRRLEENEASVASQKRFLADQDGERRRVNARFDQELSKLKPLWNAGSPSAVTSATGAEVFPAKSAAKN